MGVGICEIRPSPTVRMGVSLQGLLHLHPLLQHTNEDPADDIDECDDDAGNGVAADELAGTVHGPIKVGLLLNSLRRVGLAAR